MSTTKFFRLIADPAATSRWFLKAPIDSSGNRVDPRQFTDGVPIAPPAGLHIPLRRAGHEVLFNFADFDMVVTPSAINAELESLVGPAIQRFSVTVENSIGAYEILNSCELIKCFDETKSDFTKWTEEDDSPEDVGQLRMVIDLHIDSTAAEGHDIFRVAEWPIALVVSEKVKRLFEARGLTGVAYLQVA